MAFEIEDQCIACGAWITECMANAILEKEGRMAIDQDLCLECGDCVDVCPIEAIVIK